MEQNLLNSIKKNKIGIICNLLFLFASITLVVLNFNFVYILHNTSGMLKIVFYELYSSMEVLSFYLIIILSLVDILVLIFVSRRKIRALILSIQPLIVFFSILLIFINPQFLILFLQGVSLTKFEYLEVGAYLYIALSLFFVIFIIYEIHREGYTKTYFQYLTLLIVTFFFSSFIHENGHAFFILITGGKITQYAPFPFLDFKNFAGYISYQGVPSEFLPLVTIGGEIFQWISIGILGIILYIKKFSKWINYFLSLAIIVAWLDYPLYSLNNTFGLPHWFIFGSSSGDIIKFSNMLGIDIIFFNLLAIAQIIVGVVIIYYKVIRKRIDLHAIILTKKIQEIKTKV